LGPMSGGDSRGFRGCAVTLDGGVKRKGKMPGPLREVTIVSGWMEKGEGVRKDRGFWKGIRRSYRGEGRPLNGVQIPKKK